MGVTPAGKASLGAAVARPTACYPVSPVPEDLNVMTAPVASARPKTARYLIALAAAGVLGAVSPVALAAPATAGAAERSGRPQGFRAPAAAHTPPLHRVALRGVRVKTPPLPA